MSRDEILRLIAELRQDVVQLTKTVDAIVTRRDARDETTTFAIALLLMNYYTGSEHAFRRIATHFGGVPGGDRWHIQLLDDMAIEIPDIRPSVVSEATHDRLAALLRFRHVVRNLYAWTLRREEVQALVVEIAETNAGLTRELDAFEAALRALAR